MRTSSVLLHFPAGTDAFIADWVFSYGWMLLAAIVLCSGTMSWWLRGVVERRRAQRSVREMLR